MYRLLNSHRGWDTGHTPLQDARWALDQIAERLGRPLPTCLVGHSLGGRAALLAAGSPEVAGAVALAPWVLPTDVPPTVRGRRFLIVHGRRDRIASPRRSLALAERLHREAEVSYVCVEDGAHAMLRHHGVFDGLAARFAAATLLDGAPGKSLEPLPAGAALIAL